MGQGLEICVIIIFRGCYYFLRISNTLHIAFKHRTWLLTLMHNAVCACTE